MQFPAMRRLSISTGSAFLIVYAVDDARSYDVLKNCVQEIQEIRAADYQELPIVFAGNKCDIAREHRQVLKETVSNYVHYELATRLRAKVSFALLLLLSFFCLSSHDDLARAATAAAANVCSIDTRAQVALVQLVRINTRERLMRAPLGNRASARANRKWSKSSQSYLVMCTLA